MQVESWASSAAAAKGPAKNSSLICFGDSLVVFGVIPSVLESRLQRSCYNLAVTAGTPATSYFLLKRTLESGANPSAVIVDFTPFQLDPPAHLKVARVSLWADFLHSSELYDLATYSRAPGYAAEIVIRSFLNSVRFRDDIREAINWAFKGAVRPSQCQAFVTRWNLRANKGALVPPESAQTTQFDWNRDDWMVRNWDSTMLAYMERFLDLTAQKSITVYLLIPPIDPVQQSYIDSGVYGTAQKYEELLRSIQTKFANVRIIDARRSGYQSSMFVDSMHFNRAGSTALTDDLASAVLSELSADRWVNLSRSHRHDVAGHVEDLVESQLAIGILPPEFVQRR